MDSLATRQSWAARAELSRRALDAYGNLDAVAEATGVPKRTVFRYLSERGKDKKIPPLQFVVELVELLERDHNGLDFASFWEYATRDVE